MAVCRYGDAPQDSFLKTQLQAAWVEQLIALCDVLLILTVFRLFRDCFATDLGLF